MNCRGLAGRDPGHTPTCQGRAAGFAVSDGQTVSLSNGLADGRLFEGTFWIPFSIAPFIMDGTEARRGRRR
jgi:hypothetical protein